jgi:hypothetical protein
MSALMQWAEALETSTVGAAIAESRYAFPVIEGVHLIGLSIAVGLIAVTDLRLMGVILKQVPAEKVLRGLRPYVLAGFAIIFVSGGLLFWGEATTVLASPAFPLKLVFIALAGLNAAYFERVIARRTDLSHTATLPRQVWLAGIASLTLWSLVVICGRLIAYLPN